jgi:hypothetical protein
VASIFSFHLTNADYSQILPNAVGMSRCYLFPHNYHRYRDAPQMEQDRRGKLHRLDRPIYTTRHRTGEFLLGLLGIGPTGGCKCTPDYMPSSWSDLSVQERRRDLRLQQVIHQDDEEIELHSLSAAFGHAFAQPDAGIVGNEDDEDMLAGEGGQGTYNSGMDIVRPMSAPP